MRTYLIACLIGVFVGIIDIIPMMLQKLPKRASISAFIQYFFVSIIIVLIDLPGIVWWIEGSIIALCLSFPVMIITSDDDKKVKYIIGSFSLILGCIISLMKYFFI